MEKDYSLTTGKQEASHLDQLHAIFAESSYDLVKQANLASDAVVADIGCGAGHMTCWLAANIVPAGTVYAIDSSEGQLAVTRERAESLSLTNIEYVQADIETLDFEQQFDAVFGRWVLTHVPGLANAYQQLIKTLKPGGKLLSQEPTQSPQQMLYPVCEPIDKVFWFGAELTRLRGGETHVGLELHRLAVRDKSVTADLDVVQVLQQDEQSKQLMPERSARLLESLRPAIITQNLATEAELAVLRDELLQLTLAEDTIALGSLMAHNTITRLG